MARHGRSSTLSRDKTAFPKKQMAILALCRICEPIAFMSIFPYVYAMIEDFGVTKSNAEISVYVGMVTSAFAFAECVSSVFWGRLSDRIGRKRVLLGGLFGTGLSMILFGYANSITMALVARALGGLLNGNISVIQTTVAELVTVKKHQPRAYSIIPFVWCLGTIVGAALGGILAKPADNWPLLFKNTTFEHHPYLLANVVCAAIVLCGLAVGILFLEETHEDLKYERDRGCELGQWVLSKLWSHEVYAPLTNKDETMSMLGGNISHAYRSTNSSSRTSIEGPPPLSLGEKSSQPKLKFREVFTNQICLNIVAVGILAFHTISLEQLLPIMMSHEDQTEDPTRQLPFQFRGGFGYSTQRVGIIIACQGILQMIAQVVFYPWISKKLGNLRTFWVAIASYPFLYFIGPYLALLREEFRVPAIILLLCWKVTAQALSYPSLNIMLANSAPSKKVLGTMNGAAASSASVMRGFGPLISGAINTLGDSKGISGLAWWACAVIAIIAWIPGVFMEEQCKRPGSTEAGEDDEEAGLTEAEIDGESDAASLLTLNDTYDFQEVLPK